MDLSGATVLVPTDDGNIVTEDQIRIAEIIKDYDPYLELAWIPPQKRVTFEKPFAVVHRPPGVPPYIVFYAEHCDERILERLWAHDNNRTNVLSDLDAKNAAKKALEMKREMDAREEAHDRMKSAMRSPLNTYRLGKGKAIKQ